MQHGAKMRAWVRQCARPNSWYMLPTQYSVILRSVVQVHGKMHPQLSLVVKFWGQGRGSTCVQHASQERLWCKASAYLSHVVRVHNMLPLKRVAREPLLTQ